MMTQKQTENKQIWNRNLTLVDIIIKRVLKMKNAFFENKLFSQSVEEEQTFTETFYVKRIRGITWNGCYR